MINEFSINKVVSKVCITNVNHYLCIMANEGSDLVYRIELRISINPKRIATWYLNKPQSLAIGYGYDLLRLPYFEPDLSDYSKLIEKLRLYTIMS